MQNSMDPGRVAFNGNPLTFVLMEAFKVKKDQITGPSWLDSDCFDFIAKMPEGATRDQLPAILEALLVERFKLAAHKESHLRSGYSLIVDRNGTKFKESDQSSPATRARTGQVAFAFALGASATIKGSMTMATLARLLSTRLGDPIQDLTGIKGTYDIDLSWAPDPSFEKVGSSAPSGATDSSVADAGASVPAGKANIFTSIRNLLGLRLEAQKLQIEMIVIDSIERVPTEN